MILLIGTAGVATLGQQSSADGLKREQVKQKTLQTYYHFTGQVTADKRSPVVSNELVEIKTVEVKVGQQVKAGETLFSNINGKTYRAPITGRWQNLRSNQMLHMDRIQNLPSSRITVT